MKNKEIMIYSSIFDKKGSQTTLVNALKTIQSPPNEKEFEKLRTLYKSNKKQYDELKKQLVAFAFSGVFLERNIRGINTYTGIAILDIDKIDSLSEVASIKKQLTEIPYTAFCFISPSGHGLKVGVFMESPLELHEDSYNKVRSYYSKSLGNVAFDTKTKDISRLCFTSFDPNIYINDDSKVFTFSPTKMPKCQSASRHSEESKHLNYVINQVDSLEEYIEGNRNNYISLTSYIANRHGLNKQNVIDYFTNLDNLPDNEISNTVSSAYKNTEEFGVLKYDFAYVGDESLLIPETVYSELPIQLSKPLEYLKGKERDMALLALLAFSSSIFHNVKGKYRREELYPNLLSMIIAPPASGKGIVSIGEKLIERSVLHFDSLVDEKLRRFQLSGNSSSAMLYTRLAANEGLGIIFEKEGDAISSNFRSEWGDISVQLRQAYHNEDLTYERKKDNEMIVVRNPRFGFLVTMTPNQLAGLISNRENGLFSRVLFYVDNSPTKFESLNPADVSKDVIDEEIYNSGVLLEKWYQQNFGQLKSFNLTEKQWLLVNEMWEIRLEYWLKVYGEHNNDIVLRLMVSSFKVMMIISTWRYVGKTDTSNNIQCTDVDIVTAIQLMDVLFYHAIRATKLYLPGTRDLGIHSKVLEFFGKNEFTSSEYIEKFIDFGGSKRTAQRRLAEEQNESIKKLYHGRYQKMVA